MPSETKPLEPRVDAAPGVGADRLSRTQFRLLVALVLAVSVFVRFYHLGYDPPAWFSPDYLTDEGWWADAARGKVFFNNYFSDDFGTALLMTPAYTGALMGVYKVFGVGTIQTRAVAGVASVLTIGAVFLFLRRFFGRNEAIIAAALLAVSPFYWGYARVGLIEPTQALFVILAFILWVRRGGGRLTWFLGGISMSIAVWMKPDAIVDGFLPVAVAAILYRLLEIRALSAGERKAAGGELWRDLACGAGGIALGAAVGMALVVIPYWSRFWTMAFFESHAKGRSLGQLLTLPGTVMMSTVFTGSNTLPRIWQLARYSPALFVGFWLCGVAAFGRMAASRAAAGGSPHAAAVEGAAGSGEADPSADHAGTRRRLEIASLTLGVVMLALVSTEPQQPPRYFVELVPVMAMCAAILVGRLLRKRASGAAVERAGGAMRSFFLWLVVLVPLYILLKPVAASFLMQIGSHWHVGRHPGLSYAAGGTIFTLFWLGLVLMLASFARTAEVVRAGLLRIAPLLVAALLVAVELPTLIVDLGTAGRSFLDAQKAVAVYAADSKTIMGHIATSLFMPYKVRTVRRTTPADESPPPNPGIWHETKPRYIVDVGRYNYFPQKLRYEFIIKPHHYHLLRSFDIGPDRGGVPKFVFEVFERKGGKS